MKAHRLCFLILALTGQLAGLAAAAAATANRVRLDVLEPPARKTTIHDYPISTGLVFPQGEVTSLPGGNLVDDRGQTVPFESEVTGWWEPEKRNVKWLLLHFKASTDRHYFFEPGKSSPPSTKGAAIARVDGAEIGVDTGPLQVRMDPVKGGLFKAISLGRKAIAASGPSDLVLSIDDGRQQEPVTIRNWKMELDETTPKRASVKASGFWRKANGQTVARVDVRCEFFQGEAFIRLTHTLTWMVQDVKTGIRELSLTIVPQFENSRAAQIGLDSYPTVAMEAILDQGSPVVAAQDAADHFTVKAGDRVLREGKALGGWMALQGTDGRSIAMSLRDAWQRYPTTFRADGGRLQLQFCPPSDRLSFDQEAIMGPGIFNHPSWIPIRRYHKGPTDASHFYDNYSPNPGYIYTAEGAAFTHEVLLSFHDGRAGRSPAALNSVNQHPVVVRQDPVHAMRVPFMGFTILPSDPGENPGIERAVNQIGRMAMGRWVGVQNFGLLRYGMVRWGRHEPIEDPKANFYRWMDNGQYGQQLIPWLLYLRGGDRQFFDDAEIVSRYAMDLSTNHFNTRGSPTGYIAGCGSALPFHPFGFAPGNMKMQKIHFLAYYYHLTGYRRAREVMDEVIAGTKEFTLEYEKTLRSREPGKEYYNLSNGGREMYNMNIFWANAWEETWDPEILRLAGNGRTATIRGQYQPKDNTFNGPQVYVYDGLVLQHQLSGDPAMRAVMLRHLDVESLATHGGLTRHQAEDDSIGYPWAYAQTGNRRFADAAWDIARGMADLVPDIDFSGPVVPGFYPYEYTGNSLYREHLMPILTGASLGRQVGYELNRPHVFRDNFFQMWQAKGQKEFRAEIFVRARQAGPLTIRCLAKGNANAGLTVDVRRADGSSAAKATIASRPAASQPNQYTPFQGDLLVENARPGEVFMVTMRKADRAPVAVISEAQVVHRLPPELMHAHEPLPSAQAFTPVRIVTRTTATTMSYFNRVRRPYTLRDAKTLELIFRPTLFTEAESVRPVEAGRMIMLTSSGCRGAAEWRMTGVEPYFAASQDDWFQPYEAGWPKP